MNRKSVVGLGLVFIVLLFCIGAINYARHQSYATSSYEQTSDTAICAAAAYMTAVEVITDGTNDAKLILYDDPDDTSSGLVLLEITVVAGDHYGGRVWINPVSCANGIYADVNGTGASYIVEYIKK